MGVHARQHVAPIPPALPPRRLHRPSRSLHDARRPRQRRYVQQTHLLLRKGAHRAHPYRWSQSTPSPYARRLRQPNQRRPGCARTGPKPSSLSFEDAGSLPVVATTALQCVHAAGMPSSKKNLTVVVTSGQGGTGFMMIQIAKALGATRVITAATGAGIAFVKGIGADQVVDYHQQTLAEALPTDSVDIVIDNLGVPGTADQIMPAIRSGGTFLVLFGGNHGTISKHPKDGVNQVGFGVEKKRRTDLDELKGLFEQGKLKARTMKPIYTLAEVPAGL